MLEEVLRVIKYAKQRWAYLGDNMSFVSIYMKDLKALALSQGKASNTAQVKPYLSIPCQV